MRLGDLKQYADRRCVVISKYDIGRFSKELLLLNNDCVRIERLISDDWLERLRLANEEMIGNRTVFGKDSGQLKYFIPLSTFHAIGA